MTNAIATPALLSSLRSIPYLPNHIYYILAGATLSTLNLPQEVPGVLRFALERGSGYEDSTPDNKGKLQMARKMREAIIKLAPIAGLPKAPKFCCWLIFEAAGLTPSASRSMP